jgi:NADPH2:quinone reductase
MGYAYIIEKQGGCEVLKKTKLLDRVIEPGSMIIKQQYLGLNFNDIMLRRGDKAISSKFIPGTEACGVVEAVAQDVTDFQPGDRVVYATGPIGACTDVRMIQAKYAIKVPDFIPMEEVCGFFLKGIWAYALTHIVYKVAKHNAVLIHSAAGGVGTILTQILSHNGNKVIGTVGTKAKIDFAERNGCIKALYYNHPTFFKTICDITQNIGVNVVYDPIGRDVFDSSLLALGIFGLFVSYGSNSGSIKKMHPEILAKKSLFVTSPSFLHYFASRAELERISNAVFELRRQNVIKNNICNVFSFDALRDAHKFLEERNAMGSVVIKIQ